jgi:hypothetical protein
VKDSSAKAARLVPILRVAGLTLGAAGIIASGVLIVSTSRLETIANRLSGPAELRELADVFNQLIDQLQLHRTSQLRFWPASRMIYARH